jgi:hypothetical protein
MSARIGTIAFMVDKLPLKGGRYESLAYAIQTATDWFNSISIDYTSTSRLTITAPVHPNLKTKKPHDAKIILENDKKTLRSTIKNGLALPTMFGHVGNLLILNDKLSVEAFMDLITDEGGDQASVRSHLNKIMANGMFIVIMAAGNIKAVTDLRKIIDRDGQGFEEPHKNTGSEIDDILTKSDLSTTVKNEVRSYIGSNYEILLPIVKSLGELSAAEQRRMSFDDLMMRIPNRPGSIMPWSVFANKRTGEPGRPGLDKLALNGDCNGAITLLQRVIKGGTLPIIYSSWFCNQIRLAVGMILLEKEHYSPLESAHALGSGGPSYRKSHPDPFNDKGGWALSQMSSVIQRGVRSLRSCDLAWLLRELASDNAAIHGAGNGHSVVGYELSDGMPDDGSTIMMIMVLKTALIFNGKHYEDIDVDLEDA